MKKEHDLIIGIHAIEELLRLHPKRVIKVYIFEGVKKEGRRQRLLQELRSRGISVEFVGKSALERLSNSTSHQGFVALIKKREHMTLESFLKSSEKKKKAFVLMLDGIVDPHNMGSILRSSECLGVSAVIWSMNRGVSITPTVSKVSSGASELLTLITVANLANGVDKFKQAGFTIIGSSVTKGSRDINSYQYPLKTLLIFGSEEKGVSPILQKKCDELLYIPMRGKIDSLNVSNAAAIFLSRINGSLP